MKLNDEEREAMVAGLEALQRKLRANVKPRKGRADEYSPVDARQYHVAEDLIIRLRAET